MRTFRLRGGVRRARVDFDRELNDQQRAVATASGGPMLVVAGAGSGKTRSLTYRLAWLLEQGVEADRIMLVTFTTRAAREMVHRAQDLAPQDAGRVWCGTFHHIANRLLREHGARLGLAPQFTILDREDAGDLLGSCVAEAGVRLSRRRFPDRQTLTTIVSARASTMLPLEAVLARRFPMFADLHDSIQGVLDRYEVEKQGRQLVDYDDLLRGLLTLVEDHEDVRARLADQFLHVLVDEYQDTNPIQGRIVDGLACRHRNVCVVGDDSQSIYSFRGGDVENILRFAERYPDARTYRLEINYRSTPQVLALANASIAHNHRRLPKQLQAVRGDGLRPAVVPCGDHVVQARFVAQYILHLLDEGRDLFDIAVLYRSHWHALELQLELKAHDVPFAVRGGQRFFEQAPIKDVLSILRLLHNGHDELAWQRAVRLVPRVGSAVAHRVWRAVAETDDPVHALAARTQGDDLPRTARAPLAAFAQLLQRLRSLGHPAAVLQELLADFYGEYLRGHYEGAALREQDIEGVIAFSRQYRSLEAFLTDVALTGEFVGETCVDGPDEQRFVTLSTVHQAKGLEWPVVLIPWMADGRFPTDLAMGSTAELEEERRVFHVAVTRARDELYLVVPQVWSTHRGQRTLMKPSRFIEELEDPELLESLQLEEVETAVTAGNAVSGAHREAAPTLFEAVKGSAPADR
ncbi:MAG: ATP-dependent helicase [Planctomycetota bacterium]|jgi:DNA helicase-2/ATP-dependent DNA helicase PcrA